MKSERWHAFVDGASSGNPGPAGIGVILYAPDGKKVLSESIYLGITTNNVAEYEALKHSLKRALQFSAKEIAVYSDSQLLVNQITGIYKIRDKKLKACFKEVAELIGRFDRFLIQYVPREDNKAADSLAREAIKRGRRVAAPEDGEESPGTAEQDGL